MGMKKSIHIFALMEIMGRRAYLGYIENCYILSLKSPNLMHTRWTYVHAGIRGVKRNAIN